MQEGYKPHAGPLDIGDSAVLFAGIILAGAVDIWLTVRLSNVP